MTNLEEIKNRQEKINGLLYSLLSDTSSVVDRIIGEQPKEEKGTDNICNISGLLGEINQSQNITETFITYIAGYINLLYQGTFNAELTAVVESK